MSRKIEHAQDGKTQALPLGMVRQIPAGAAALMLGASVLALSSGTARADCAPAPTAGNDTILCDNAPAPGGANLDALAGNDTITITGGTYGTIDGNLGVDTFNLDPGGIVGTVNGGGGGDIINLDGATVNGSIFGQISTDTINLNSGTVSGFVDGGAEIDTITINGATINNDVLGGNGADILTLNSGTVSSNLGGSAGNDTVTVNGGTVTNMTGGADNDTLNVNGGTINTVQGNAGTDNISLNGGTVTGFVVGDDGDDTITLDGATVFDLHGDSGFGFAAIGNDTINILSGSAGHVDGDDGDDTITMSGGAITGGIGILDIDGGAGIDQFFLNGGTVDGNINGEDGNDTIQLNGTAVAGDLTGGLGDDTFNVLGGSFGGSLLAGDGSDTATFGPAFDLSTVAGTLDGGALTDTLNLNGSGSLTADNVINWETINVAGGNVTFLGGTLATGAGLGMGLNITGGGIVDLDDGLAITGDVTNGGTLIANSGGGSYSVSGVLANNGTINMSDGVGAGDTLTVGTFDGGGTLLMDVALDASLAGDQLVLSGFVDFDTTVIVLTDVAPGNPAVDTGIGPGNGIPLVDASGAGPLASDFALAGGSITKAPFTYNLVLETDDIFYLQTGILSQVYAYSILTEVMRPDFALLRDRLGGVRYNGFGDSGGASSMLAPTDNAGIWARIDGTKRDIDHSGGAESGAWDASRAEAEVGLDIPMELFGGVSVFGVSIHAIHGNADATSGVDPTAASSDVGTTGFGAGLSMAFFPGGGLYVDVQGRLTAWDADVEATGLDQDVDALSWGTSLEVGNRLMVAPNTSVTPRGRAIYSDVHFDGFTDSAGAVVSQDDSASVIVEAGVTVEQLFPDNGVTMFVDASVNHDVLSDSSVDVSGFEFESGLDDTWGQMQFGLAAEVANGASAFVAADVGSPFSSNFGDSWSYGLEAGFRLNF